ncbi:MAG: IS110 family transposase, partial [Planctomycetota bacterium]
TKAREKGAAMKIIGCDFHPSYQQVAWLDTESGEVREATLAHENGEARRFYESLRGPVRVGMEAVGNTLWFERLRAGLGHEVWIGDAARIRSLVVRRQKTDRRDALHVLELLTSDRFPRIWVPGPEQRDTRQLLFDRHKLVRLRARVKNELQHLALNQGVRRKRQLWSTAGRQVLESLPLDGWTAQRRQDLLALLDQLHGRIGELDRAVEAEAARHPAAQLLQTHPGIGPVTGLAYVLTLGPWQRFRGAKAVASYLGLNPREHSSGGRQKRGAIRKQGHPLLRSLLVEAALSAVRGDAELRRPPAAGRLAQRKHTARRRRVMVARKLAVRWYWMLRSNQPYAPRPAVRMPGSPRHSVVAV